MIALRQRYGLKAGDLAFLSTQPIFRKLKHMLILPFFNLLINIAFLRKHNSQKIKQMVSKQIKLNLQFE